MNDSEKANVYLEIAKMAQSAFFNRRDYEWKVTLGFWGLIVAAIAMELYIHWFLWLLALVVYTFCWLRYVEEKHDDDKKLSKHYWEAADALTKNPDHPTGEHPLKRSDTQELCFCRRHLLWWKEWGVRFQFLVTAFLCLLAIWLKH